ncbi:DMT family transporter [Adhaeribacter soli]|uniref:DMT family transporter n=1 Tax=Adhaeribacter soli TaxID=2607655 RepID=A0A5N1ITV6_9BACT|nr:DMT family transporter [Adhaeribacter soli]KAA9333605.1 DMT family transporter [Adhaeribacter soli]
MPRFRDVLELHFIIFLWGFTAILGKLISIPAVELVAVRTLIACLALALIIKFRKGIFRIGTKPTIQILGVGLLLAAHWILFFASARVASVSISLAGLATSSLWTAILEPLFTKKKIKPHEILLAIIIMIGLYVIFQFEFDHAIGITMAVGSALMASIFTIINSRLTKVYPAATISCYEMGGAFLGTVAFLPIYTTFFAENHTLDFSLSSMDWVYLITLTLVCTVYAYTGAVRLMQKISAFAMNLTVNLEPVYGIVLAWLIFGQKEQMSIGFYYGTLIILGTVFIYPVMDSYYNRRQALKAPLPGPESGREG